MKNILIVGANFGNKGAQSMLFVTVDSIKRMNPDSNCFFATTEKYDEQNFTFKKFCYSKFGKYIALHSGLQNVLYRTKSIITDMIRFVFGKSNHLFKWHFNSVKSAIREIDLIIDISGFNLGKKWSSDAQESYLDNIRIAKKYNIPIILMPQSFGPFDYESENKYLLKEIAELLTVPEVIFAREKDGYDALVNMFHLTNVKISSDMVLQSQGIDENLIFTKQIESKLPNLVGEAVGIIPNNQCFSFGDIGDILECYRVIIDELLSAKKEIYIFRHSGEDLTHCRKIYEMYKNNKRVHLLENDFSCIEYDEFVKNFQFIVCSRFHGIVHAYRNGVPAIVLGWAVKYKELTESVLQNQYMFDITAGHIESRKVKEIVDNMIANYSKESEIICERVAAIQKDNCFDALKKYL